MRQRLAEIKFFGSELLPFGKSYPDKSCDSSALQHRNGKAHHWVRQSLKLGPLRRVVYTWNPFRIRSIDKSHPFWLTHFGKHAIRPSPESFHPQRLILG